ncbi:hypothetical protein EVAR_69805_1 [Eumeta japonica]|uniref:Uncharacterized protein n=1 Tax=Eumeta variegata TaxID=151549 RepID=A0A4C1Z687_EUMVA|nr:hypothetical protein EVAR_69805_1 [Eumeta japonica]
MTDLKAYRSITLLAVLAGVSTVAYADDITVLMEAPSRSESEKRSQVALDLIRRLLRPLTVRRGATLLSCLIGYSAGNGGIGYRSLKIIYRDTYLATLTYAAGYWHQRAKLYVVRSVLLRAQQPALTLLTKTSTAILPMFAGVLPADLKLLIAGRVENERDRRTRIKNGMLRREIRNEMIQE